MAADSEETTFALQTLTPEAVDELVNRRLPASLLDTLERRWYESFDIHKYQIQSTTPAALEAETRFLQIFEVAYTQDVARSFHLANMQNVLSSLRDGSHSLAYVATSNGEQVKLLMGVRRSRLDSITPTDEYINVMHRALRSNYPGIVLSQQADEQYHDVDFADYKVCILDPMQKSHYLAAITGIPSLRQQENWQEAFGQSIDRLVDALRGEAYTLLVLAEPILEERVNHLINQARLISEQVHALVLQSRSISRSETASKQTTRGKSEQFTLGTSQLISAILSVSGSVSKSISDTIGFTRGVSASITQERLDKTAQFCEQLLEHYINRLQSGRSLGFWNTGVFLTSDDRNTFLRAQWISRALFSGQNTYFEPIRILNLEKNLEVRRALGNLRIPALKAIPGENRQSIEHPLGQEYQSLGTPLTTDELSILVSFPNREVPGLKLKPVADFNLNPPAIKGTEIGSLLYRGEKLPSRIAISSKSLTRHTFVTGLTGSGKTNTCLALLANGHQSQQLKFLVIDPAKTEYRLLLNSRSLGKDLVVFTLNDESLAPFRLNPFEFEPDFPLLTHIDLLKAVFNAAFPMYASMPYLLEEAMLAVYQERGWNITDSTNDRFKPNSGEDHRTYLPRLSDLRDKIDEVVKGKGYDERIARDLTAALKARIGSLCQGTKGLMLDTQRSTPFQALLDRPVVLELRRVGDDDEKAFLMALLFIRLYEACQTRKISNDLCHVTLIEEAHRLLRNVPILVSSEIANTRGKAVEMFADMMAEMRAYGEGFIIVDQVPNKLVPDVIKGSNLKFVHRLLADDDRRAVGNAMGLTSAQIEHLSRLTLGQAVVHSEELGEACLVKIDSVEEQLMNQPSGSDPHDKSHKTEDLLRQHAKDFEDQQPQPNATSKLIASEPEEHRLESRSTSVPAVSSSFGPGHLPFPYCVGCLPLWKTGRCLYGKQINALRSAKAWREKFEAPMIQVLETSDDPNDLWLRLGQLGTQLIINNEIPLGEGQAEDVVYCNLVHITVAIGHHPAARWRQRLGNYVNMLSSFHRSYPE
ncbi:MAG: ATP-binding protein [Chloroflexi bacterium]|nr:ATP-binding protein [Chloroflexota bacterium]